MPPFDIVHYRLLKIISDQSVNTQRELARELGISLGKLNYCLKALMEKGWVKVRRFYNNPNKHGYAYLLTPSGIEGKAHMAAHFLGKKMKEYEALQNEIAELQEDCLESGKL